MRNLRLIIAYDGTGYSGWQIQPNAVTIQELIQRAVRGMTGEENNVVGAGRTDKGVHALAQVAQFRTEKGIPADGFRRGLNTLLPKDIRILGVDEVGPDFHPIRDARSKQYRYLIAEAEFEDPLTLNRAWCVDKKLDIDRMRRAADCLIGRHDFSSFRAADGCDDNPVREIFSLSFRPFAMTGEIYQLDITGSGFLKNMVRNIVGTLVDVGLGKTSPEGFKAILESRDRKKAGVCAPACGLYLVGVEY